MKKYENMTIEERRESNKIWYEKQMRSKNQNNAKLFTKEAPDKCGRFVELSQGKYGFCLGIVLGDDDYYWLVINQDRKIEFHSGVGYLDYYDDNMLPSQLFILNYLLDNDYNFIIDTVKNVLSKNSDYLISDLYLKKTKYKKERINL
jgi:hypothetical protein